MDEDGFFGIEIEVDNQGLVRDHLNRMIRYEVYFPIGHQVDLACGDDPPVCSDELRLAYPEADLGVDTGRDVLGNGKKVLNLLEGQQVDPACAAEKNDRSSFIR